MQEKAFFNVLPYINFGLSFLIVMHHSFNVNVDYNTSVRDAAWAFERFFYNISECAVPVFFFFSAVLFYRNYMGTKIDYFLKIKRRVISIVIPYVIFNIFGYFKHIVFGSDSFSAHGLLVSIAVSDTMPLWFLRELFFLALLAPVINFVRKRKIMMAIGIQIIAILIVLGVVKYRSFVYWAPVYCIGASVTIDRLMEGILYNKYICKKLAGIISVIGLIIYAWFLPNSIHGNDYVGNFVFFVFRMFCIIAITIILTYIGKLEIRKSPEWMNYSFWVYCIHFPLISICKLFISKVTSVETPLMRIFEYCVTVVVVYATAVFIALILKKVSPCVWSVLNGSRK